MNALSQDARALIDGVLKRDDPTDADKARVRIRLAAELGAAAFATLALSAAGTAASAGTTALAASGGASASGNAAQGTTWSLLSKLSLSAAALALAAGVLWLSGGEREQRNTRAPAERAAPQVVSAPTPAALAFAKAARDEAAANAPVNETVAPRIAAAQEAAPRGESKHVAAPRKVAASQVEAPAAAPTASTLGQELKMLAEAQAALRAGAPERALALAAQHRASFPDGVMKEERQGIEALAGCALGRDYRAQAEQFLQSAQSSPLAARVRKACGIEP
jgi:hypothetical protein